MSEKTLMHRQGYAMVDVTLLRQNPLNPRTKYDEAALKELTESVRVFGVLEPLLVTPTDDGCYMVVAGERRRRAALAAGIQRVPVVIEERSTTEQLEVQLCENLLREDLGPVDEARAIQRLLTECGMTQEQLGARLGKSQPWISNRIRLLRLPETVIAAMAEGKLTPGHAQELLKYDKAPKLVEAAAKWIVEKKLPVSEVEAQAIRPSDADGETRSFGYGVLFNTRRCTKCENYRKAGYSVFCLDPVCFDAKVAEAKAAEAAKFKDAGGLTVQGLLAAGTAYADQWQLKQVKDAQCETCDKLRKAKPSYGNELEEICLDPECCKRKRAILDDARKTTALAAMNAELDQIRVVADEAAAGLEPKHLVLLLMELLRAEAGQRRHHDAGKEWPGRKQLLGHCFGRAWPVEEYWHDVDFGDKDRADKMRSLAENLLTRKPAQLRAALVEWALLSGIDKLGPVLELVGMGGQATPKAAAATNNGDDAPPDEDDEEICPNKECPHWDENGCTAPSSYACPLDETELAAAEENGEPEPDDDEDPESDTQPPPKFDPLHEAILSAANPQAAHEYNQAHMVRAPGKKGQP